MKRNAAHDLLEALRSEAVPDVVPKGFYTITDLSAQTGIPDRTLRRKLKAIGAECRMIKIKTGLVTRPVPHYGKA